MSFKTQEWQQLDTGVDQLHGTKVKSNSLLDEPTGPVASDSLADESLRRGGRFAANDQKISSGDGNLYQSGKPILLERDEKTYDATEGSTNQSHAKRQQHQFTSFDGENAPSGESGIGEDPRNSKNLSFSRNDKDDPAQYSTKYMTASNTAQPSAGTQEPRSGSQVDNENSYNTLNRDRSA